MKTKNQSTINKQKARYGRNINSQGFQPLVKVSKMIIAASSKNP
ncbi:MAG: hypothetical protein ACOC0C_08945 [Bacteroidota bacterium]